MPKRNDRPGMRRVDTQTHTIWFAAGQFCPYCHREMGPHDIEVVGPDSVQLICTGPGCHRPTMIVEPRGDYE